MSEDLYAKARAAEHSITGKRWCSQCQMGKQVDGRGNWKTGKGNKTRRWECGDCADRRAKREASGTLRR